ncbi:DUF3367 domain-containing protein [Corynebacterium sp. 13CS0277]|uniref:alpha-(1->3)-arabinofuranosyltransferase domain-containing protein n=1 Tax=Corynebacterium sp. 13CS0277 TaxID=2071994 RepID=UPI000D035B09|nr:alpha-(1->3)-arabinofuranosyltransferase family protein [Corynebacterium sp. 13CS0277]PRQ11843.1 DUF3367 domain-containing protein [Corynebacterium sp. 13CS0277]
MMRFSAASSTAHATSRLHLACWAVAAAVVFLPGPAIAADTKHDLVADPWHFLAQATSAYSEVFPFGQVQNQAFGYLFPQGLFFLLPGPEWLIQRLWWWLLLCVGASGMLRLTHKVGMVSPWARGAAVAAFVCAPRIIGVLSTISSEAWPAMLTPWAVAAVLRPQSRFDGLPQATLAVACMGAVNATVTALAILPALLVVAAQRNLPRLLAFGALLVAVSLWWLVPLFVLGAYAVPFVDFIESAWATTRVANAAEALRGTSHWVAFVSVERTAAHHLALQPVAIIVTGLVAAAGVFGLARRGGRTWVVMFLVGFCAIAAAAGPFGPAYREFLDTTGVALRNVHKWDVVLRLPLALGVGWAVEAASDSTRRAWGVLVLFAALAPVGMLLPVGAYEEVPEDVRRTADFVNAHPDGRALILPAAPFAHQEWGWTRDEPLQPLLRVPWAVRDAVPLVHPETIRGLDGLQRVLLAESVPADKAFAAARSFGIGQLIVRGDSPGTRATAARLIDRAHQAGLRVTDCGDYHVVAVPPAANPGHVLPVPAAAGGEAVALISALVGVPVTLVDADPEIVTDTPARVAHNFGAVDRADSSFLQAGDEGGARGVARDYPATSPETVLAYGGADVPGSPVVVSSSASDAQAVGTDQERAPQYALDGDALTAWYPAPGDRNPSFTVRATTTRPEVTVTITGRPAQLQVSGADPAHPVRVDATPGLPVTVRVPGGPTDQVRIALPGSRGRTGLAEVDVHGVELVPRIEVPPATHARLFLFSRLQVASPTLERTFTLPRSMRLTLTADECALTIDGTPASCGEVTLAAGTHTLSTRAHWVMLQEVGYSPARPSPLPVWNTGLTQAPGVRVTGEQISLGAGLVGSLSATRPEVSFAGARTYRVGLAAGGVVAVLTVVLCGVAARRRAPAPQDQLPRPTPSRLWPAWWAGAVALCGVVGGIPGILAGLVTAGVVAWFPQRRCLLAAGGAFAACWWLTLGPGYTGAEWPVAAAGCVVIASLLSTRS